MSETDYCLKCLVRNEIDQVLVSRSEVAVELLVFGLELTRLNRTHGCMARRTAS